MPCAVYNQGLPYDIFGISSNGYVGLLESSDTLMHEFYRMAQGKSEKVQTFVLHLERALKAIKQQHPYAMAKEKGHRHLKDHLFHGLKSNLCNALHICMTRPTPNVASW